MQHSLTIVLAFGIGAVLGGIGMGIVSQTSAANLPIIGFHAVAVSGSGGVAWFVGQDGSARMCTGNNAGATPTAAQCFKVNYEVPG
jgi:hypothetical protein